MQKKAWIKRRNVEAQQSIKRGRRFVEGHERQTRASQKYQKFEQHKKFDNKDLVIRKKKKTIMSVFLETIPFPNVGNHGDIGGEWLDGAGARDAVALGWKVKS